MDKVERKILIIENSSEDFYKARFMLTKYLISQGWEVFAFIPESKLNNLLKDSGLKLYEFNFNRKNKSIFQLIKLIPVLYNIIKENNIQIIHSFRFQPNLLNVLTNLFNKKKIIIHITGLGIAYSNNKYLLLKFASNIIYQLKMIRANKIIVQNDNDPKDILFSCIYSKKFKLIKGSGVNTDHFDQRLYNKAILRKKLGFNENDIICTCITRLIWEKGIKEMVTAFENGIKKDNKTARLLIIGWSDLDNPRHVDQDYIDKFKNNSNIYFLGKIDDVREYLAISNLYIYPSYYREGIPRGILEALCMKLPILTTNTPGCKLTIDPINSNGYLVNPKSSIEIYNKIQDFINLEVTSEMENNSRELALNTFSETIIYSEIEKSYH